MKSKEVSPTIIALALAAALILLVGGGYFYLRPRENNPVPPDGYKNVNKEEFAAKRGQQMREYMNSRR